MDKMRTLSIREENKWYGSVLGFGTGIVKKYECNELGTLKG